MVEQFAAEADRQVIDAIAHADVEQPGHPLLDRAEAVYAILEHEAMHQETLLYMWHRLPLDQKHSPPGYRPRVSGSPPSARMDRGARWLRDAWRRTRIDSIRLG